MMCTVPPLVVTARGEPASVRLALANPDRPIAMTPPCAVNFVTVSMIAMERRVTLVIPEGVRWYCQHWVWWWGGTSVAGLCVMVMGMVVVRVDVMVGWV